MLEDSAIKQLTPDGETPEFKQYSFLPPHPKRQGEGGLRKQGIFKFSDEKYPLVSIVTVVFNGAKYLENTILSVINQSYHNIEYIIIDGGSTDETLEIINKYSDRIDYWVSEPDLGIYDAMNKGIAVSKGDLIGLLNSGDFYASDALEEVINIYQNAIQQENYCLAIAGAIHWLDEEGNSMLRVVPIQAIMQANINWSMPINHQATFISRKIHKKLGLYEQNYKICGDYDFIFKAYHDENVQFIFSDRDIAYVRMGGLSDRLDTLWLRTIEQFSIRSKRVNLIKNIFISTHWYLMAVIRQTGRKIMGKKIMSMYYNLRYNK